VLQLSNGGNKGRKMRNKGFLVWCIAVLFYTPIEFMSGYTEYSHKTYSIDVQGISALVMLVLVINIAYLLYEKK
jgi:hypothetical protein